MRFQFAIDHNIGTLFKLRHRRNPDVTAMNSDQMIAKFIPETDVKVVWKRAKIAFPNMYMGELEDGGALTMWDPRRPSFSKDNDVKMLGRIGINAVWSKVYRNHPTGTPHRVTLVWDKRTFHPYQLIDDRKLINVIADCARRYTHPDRATMLPAYFTLTNIHDPDHVLERQMSEEITQNDPPEDYPFQSAVFGLENLTKAEMNLLLLQTTTGLPSKLRYPTHPERFHLMTAIVSENSHPLVALQRYVPTIIDLGRRMQGITDSPYSGTMSTYDRQLPYHPRGDYRPNRRQIYCWTMSVKTGFTDEQLHSATEWEVETCLEMEALALKKPKDREALRTLLQCHVFNTPVMMLCKRGLMPKDVTHFSKITLLQ